MQIEKDVVKRRLKRLMDALLNPSFLLCFGLAWMITNGWCYLFLCFGALFSCRWMTIVGGTYASLLWLPFTPEKILTLSLSILFLRLFFPHDQKTLQALRDEYAVLRKKLSEQAGHFREWRQNRFAHHQRKNTKGK